MLTADDTLDSIQRKTDLVISHLTNPNYSDDQKIRSLELYVEVVEDELKLRPPRKRRHWWSR